MHGSGFQWNPIGEGEVSERMRILAKSDDKEGRFKQLAGIMQALWKKTEIGQVAPIVCFQKQGGSR